MPEKSQPARSSSLPGCSGSGCKKRVRSDSGGSGEADKQVERLKLHNFNIRVSELLRVESPGLNLTGSKRHKQSLADLVTIAKTVEHCRGDPTALQDVVRLAAEVADGKLIKKPMAAWIKRVKDAGLFYRRDDDFQSAAQARA